jgi:hypothetical protein
MKNIDSENNNNTSLCKNCLDAHHNISGVNNRCQTSILLLFSNKKSILVDCGVTFRDSALKAFRSGAYEFPQICGYIATRNSPDSILGVDDIREVTTRGEKISLYAPSAVLDSLNRMFPYIMPSSKPLSANQLLLWVAGLTPVDGGSMKQGKKFTFQTAAATPAETAASKKANKKNEKKQQQQQQEEELKEEAATPIIHQQEVEMISIGKSEKDCRENCGFVISLENDGKLIFPNYNNSALLSKVALYLPIDVLSESKEQELDVDETATKHYSTPPQEILKHFEIEVAMIAFPNELTPSLRENKTEDELVETISEMILKNEKWKEVKIKKIVVVCLPHNVVTSSKENPERKFCSFGYDTETIWERKNETNSKI